MLSVGGFVAYTIAGLRTPHSLLDPRLFKLRGFRAGSITIVVQFMAVFGFFFVGLQFVQLILGYSPFKGALAMLPVAAVVLPMSQQTPKLVARFGLRTVMAVGLLSLAAGMDSPHLPVVSIILVIAAIGVVIRAPKASATVAD